MRVASGLPSEGEESSISIFIFTVFSEVHVKDYTLYPYTSITTITKQYRMEQEGLSLILYMNIYE